MSLKVKNNKITFVNSGNGGRAGVQDDFSISRNQVAVLGLKFSVFLDDDEYFIVFVNYTGQCYLVNSMFINADSFLRIQRLFQIDFDISSYGEDYYVNEKSVIKYPLSFAGKPLFREDKTFFDKMRLSWNRLTGKKNPAWDYLSESSKQVVQNK